MSYSRHMSDAYGRSRLRNQLSQRTRTRIVDIERFVIQRPLVTYTGVFAIIYARTLLGVPSCGHLTNWRALKILVSPLLLMLSSKCVAYRRSVVDDHAARIEEVDECLDANNAGRS